MKSSEQLVLAFDVGTTTIAASLLNRVTGERLASAGRLNPQREFGADVVTRLAAALSSDEESQAMTRLINGELESLATELCTKAGVNAADIASMAAAGNSVIEHLLLGLPVNSLAFPPYRPLFPSGMKLRTTQLGGHWMSTVVYSPCRGVCGRRSGRVSFRCINGRRNR